MKATFNQPKKDGFNPNHRKQSGFSCGYKALAIEGERIKEILDLRIYQPQSICYVALWVQCNNHASGTGKAGGYGYHKPSAAAESAFQSAGYELDESIGGRGDSMIEKAIESVCALHGYENVTIIRIYP